MSVSEKSKRVIVIGAGLGGISAAISLSQRGYRVAIHEKNSQIGGKLNLLKADGYSFDLGPSILTLPHVFEKLFTGSNRKMSDYFKIIPVRPHWRSFFEDAMVIDLHPDPKAMAAEALKAGEDPINVEKFLAYSSRLYDLIDSGYFQKGLETTSAVQFDSENKPERRHIESAPVSVSPDASAQIGGLRILVVDDEPDARALLQRLLEDYHATVFVAGSADEAVMLVESKRPDVVVSDIGMPGEDGYAFIRRVRALPPDHGGNTPAVALTAYARAEDRVQAILAGFQHHISKPVEPAELIAMIASLANRIPIT